MRNKKIKILFGAIAFCTTIVTASYIAPGKQTTFKHNIQNNADISNDNVVPSSMFDIEGTTLYGWTSTTTSASLNGYDTIVIPASVQTLANYCFIQSTDKGKEIGAIDDSNKNIKKIISEVGSELLNVGKLTILDNSSHKLPGITDIDLSNSINLQSLSTESFAGTLGATGDLKTVKLAGSIKDIPTECFTRNPSLSDINLGDLSNLHSIQVSAFKYCSNLSSISFPESLDYIGDGAFQRTILKNVIFPKNLTRLGWWSFASCGTTIESLDFSKCSGLKTISYCCFENSLSTSCSVIFNDGLECISTYAIKNLSNYAIPKTVKDIGAWVYSISGLPTATYVFSQDEPNSNIWLLFQTGNEASYQSIENPNLKETNNSIYGIAYGVFSHNWGDNNKYSGTVTLPDNLHYINESGFSGQNEINEYLNIPKCLKVIDDWAFYFNDLISSLPIPKDSQLEYIGASAIGNCGHLTRFDFSNAKKLYYLGDYAFACDKVLAGVNLADNIKLKQIGAGCFQSDAVLQHITFPYTLVNIGTNAFKDDNNVEDVYFSYISSQFTDPYFGIVGIENLPKLKYGAHVYIPRGMTKQDYLKYLPDLPPEYSYDSTVWDNWDANTPEVHYGSNVNWDKILFIIFGSLAGVMLIVIVALTIALAKKKVHKKHHHSKKKFSRF